MQLPTFQTVLVTISMFFTIPTNALPSQQPQDPSIPVPETLERRVDDTHAPLHICRNEPLPDVNWERDWPEDIHNNSYTSWSELCFTKMIPGNVGCGCVNFQARAYCSPFLGRADLRIFGRQCEETCSCILPPLGDFDDMDDEDISAGTGTGASERGRLGRGRSSSSRGFASLLSSSSVASLSGYEADSDPLTGLLPSSTTLQQQCSAKSCQAMTDCSDGCVCGLAVQKYTSIDPLFPPWSCVASYAQKALAAAAVGSVLKNTRPRTHHRPSYSGLGGRDLREEEEEEEEDEAYDTNEVEGEEGYDDADDEDKEEGWEWACPCNGTFAHGACCETREGEVWNVPNLLKSEI